jgi:hypothetical protein
MRSLLRRLFVRDLGPPPPPDIAHVPSFSGQTVVDTLYSDSKHCRAIITRDTPGTYRVYVQSWDTSDWKIAGEAFWSGHGSGSLTDTLEVARTLAREKLVASP